MRSMLNHQWLALAPLLFTLRVQGGPFSDGGATILSQNHLDGSPHYPMDGSGALLLSHPRSFQDSVLACGRLGEQLWTRNSTLSSEDGFSGGLNNSFSWLVFDRQVPVDQLFWISRSQCHDVLCRAIDPKGKLHRVKCETQLPAICTQSAPVSNSTFSDSSTRWQVKQNVSNTQFTGYRDAHVWNFKGIRYAAKPARFTNSELFIETGNVSAIRPGAACAQPIGEVASGSSEDCLFLNIWTPYLSPSTPSSTHVGTRLKPVMLYLHGGGFITGSANNVNADGTNLASRGDVVVVAINYRVGNLGFLPFNDGIHNGNYALSDMVTALRWIQQYVQFFGGDPNQVTLFGESAGAQAIHILLGSPKATGLFHRAIMQSDPAGYANGTDFIWGQYASIADAFEHGTTKVLQDTGCLNAGNHIACLEKFDGFALANLTTNFNGAIIDGAYILNHELVLNRPGIASNITVMTGTNRDEAGVLIAPTAYPSNGTSFVEYFRDNVGLNVNLPSNYSLSVPLQSFQAANDSSPERILNASISVATDGEFTCYDLAKAYSGAKHRAFKATYAFQFNRTYSTYGYTTKWCDAPKTANLPLGDPDGEYYKCHGAEKLIIFGNAVRSGQPDRDGLDVPFMQLMVDYWSAFGRTGDPNPDEQYLAARGYYSSLAQVHSSGRWDPVDAAKPTLRLLQWNGAQVPFVQTKQCEALGIPWDILEV